MYRGFEKRQATHLLTASDSVGLYGRLNSGNISRYSGHQIYPLEESIKQSSRPSIAHALIKKRKEGHTQTLVDKSLTRNDEFDKKKKILASTRPSAELDKPRVKTTRYAINTILECCRA